MGKLFGYARVSSKGQSLEIQEAALAAAAVAWGHLHRASELRFVRQSAFASRQLATCHWSVSGKKGGGLRRNRWSHE